MAETAAVPVVRECPECGLSLPMGPGDCPCCGCAPGGTGLVDHLPASDADIRQAPLAFAVAGLVALEAVLAVLAPVAAAVVGGVVVACALARLLRRDASRD